MTDQPLPGSHEPPPEQSEMRARFAQLVMRPDPLIDLGAAWACISAEGNPLVEAAALVADLDVLSERVRAGLSPQLQALAWPDAGIRTAPQLAAILERQHEVLYGDLVLTGAPRHVWEPGHSFLGEVLRTHTGLPISLCVIELEVGWRLGLPLYGIGLPGHFIVGAPDGVLIDPYRGGRRLTPGECQAIVREATGRTVAITRVMLRPAARREILARILGNLRGIYLARREWASALWTVEYLMLLDPADLGLRRDRSILFGRIGRFTDAVTGLQRYLEEAPGATDGDEVRLAMAIFGGRRN